MWRGGLVPTGGQRLLVSGPTKRPISCSASLVFTDYSQVDVLRVRYTSANFIAEKSPGSANW